MSEADAIPTGPSAEGQHRKQLRVNIRRTHRTLYRRIMTVSITSVLLGANYWASHPTFNPYGVSKYIIGWAFFVLGASLLAFLNFVRHLRMVRTVLWLSAGAYAAWALVNMQQWDWNRGKASLALPIAFGYACVTQALSALELPVRETAVSTPEDL